MKFFFVSMRKSGTEVGQYLDVFGQNRPQKLPISVLKTACLNRLIPTFGGKSHIFGWANEVRANKLGCVIDCCSPNQVGQKWDSLLTAPPLEKNCLTSHSK